MKMSPQKSEAEADANTSVVSDDGAADVSHDPYFEPVVSLPEVEVQTLEEKEEELVKLRCRLYRFHKSEESDTAGEWKERGIGDVKILVNNDDGTVRLLMRQEKTLKIRANHFITPYMELKTIVGSDKAWVWSTLSDFADEEVKKEMFAIRFGNVENATLFHEKFTNALDYATVQLVKARKQIQEAILEVASAEVLASMKERSLTEEKGEAEDGEVVKQMENLKVETKADEQ